MERLITDRIDVDQLYFGYDLKINDKLIMHQPVIREMLDSDLTNYYKVVNVLTATPYDYMSELWDKGIDFTKISDMEFFIMLFQLGIKKEYDKVFKLFFGKDFNFMNMELCKRGDELILFDKDNMIIIDDDARDKIAKGICIIHGIKKQKLKPAGKRAKEVMIDIDREEKANKKPKELQTSSLLPIFSSVLNSPGFKYNREETLELNMFFFTDCVARIKLKDVVDGLAIGYYTGSLDSKKFKPEKQLNWMKDLYD